jgi:hypothetical protein
MNILDLKFQVTGIQKILLSFQNKHKNARYNPEPFENTECLSVCMEKCKNKKYMFTKLVSENNFPDVNFGINNVYYTVLNNDDHVTFGKINNLNFIKKVNDMYTDIDENMIRTVKTQKNKDSFHIDTDSTVARGSTVILFINFYHFLEKNDDPRQNINLKMTCYMARFENLQPDGTTPTSFLQKISTKKTKYYTNHIVSNIICKV